MHKKPNAFLYGEFDLTHYRFKRKCQNRLLPCSPRLNFCAFLCWDRHVCQSLEVCCSPNFAQRCDITGPLATHRLNSRLSVCWSFSCRWWSSQGRFTSGWRRGRRIGSTLLNRTCRWLPILHSRFSSPIVRPPMPLFCFIQKLVQLHTCPLLLF